MKAKNAGGESAWTTSAAAAPAPPAAVASVSAAHNGSSLSVSWEASALAARYDVEYQETGASSWSSAATDHTGATLSMSGVHAGKSYTARVKAKNACGASAWTTSAATAPAAPAAVSSVSVTHNGTSLTVSWAAPARAATYDVEYQESGATGWTSAATDHTNASLTVSSGVSAGKSYTVRVKAKNAGGASDWTTSAAASQAQQDPAAPGGFSATAGDGQVTLSWSAVDGATGYEYQQKTGGEFGATWADAGTGTSKVVSGLDNGTEHTFRLRAVKGSGESKVGGTPTASQSATPQAASPDAVSSVNVTHNGDSLTVTWGAAARAASYDVEYQETGASSWSSAAADHTGTSIGISGVDSAKSYTMRVKAKNAGGASDWTTSASVSRPVPSTASVSLSAPSSVAEGATVTVTATLSQALSADVTIPVTLTAGSAEAGDYGTLTGIAITAGQTTGTGSVTTTDDTGDNDDETFTVSLDTANLPSSVTAGSPTSATVTITDDDPPTPAWARMRWDGTDLLVWWWPGSGPRPAGYEYTVGTGSPTGAGNQTWASISGLDKTATPIIRVYAVNGDDRSPASDAAVWWPPAPGNVSGSVSAGSSDGVANVTLSWDAVSDATKYRYRVDSGAWTKASSGVVVADLDRGSSYAFEVQAYAPIYPGGRSEWSSRSGSATVNVPAQ